MNDVIGNSWKKLLFEKKIPPVDIIADNYCLCSNFHDGDISN